ncbi:unnamed protein product [Toxocara canis]|uniref:G_PROTEIN_RECEP_F1_2 domain-containing protein n=1 Tax=Toxocara canis TaxID=6265 RepID=A0A183V179_TOXCA|nr:unnamed protein product [Toxocara canis]
MRSFQREHAPKVDIVYKVYFGWLQLPLAIIALTLTVFYIMAVYRAIKSRRVSRKCYVLLLNRAIGDLLCCVSALITVAYVLLVKNIRREIIGVIDSFFIGCFWSATVSYVALSLLKFFAVWKPFDYRQAITMRRCVKLCMMSWVIFALMVCYTLSATALVKIPVLQKWSGCRIETCLVIMYRSRNMLTAIVYVFTIVVFAFTVMFVQRAHKFARSFRTKNGDSANETRFRFPLWKLSLNVGTFAVLNLFYVIWAMFMLVQDQCFFQHYYAEMMRLLGLISNPLSFDKKKRAQSTAIVLRLSKRVNGK